MKNTKNTSFTPIAANRSQGGFPGNSGDAENISCVWQLIYDRMVLLGALSKIEAIMPMKDWSTAAAAGGVRTMKRDDLFPLEHEQL